MTSRIRKPRRAEMHVADYIPIYTAIIAHIEEHYQDKTFHWKSLQPLAEELGISDTVLRYSLTTLARKRYILSVRKERLVITYPQANQVSIFKLLPASGRHPLKALRGKTQRAEVVPAPTPMTSPHNLLMLAMNGQLPKEKNHVSANA